MSREDIEEAIEVLEDASAEMLTETGEENYYCEAIAILRQALVDADDTSQKRVDEKAKREQEPVAWRWKERINSDFDSWVITSSEPPPYAIEQQPLYTSPPKRDLTCVCGAVWEGEMMVHPPSRGCGMSNLRQAAQSFVDCWDSGHFFTDRHAERIRALRAALAEPEHDPVAWISEGGDVSRSKRYMDEMGFKCNPLYTSPQKQWVGLTDDDVIYFRYQATFCDEFDAAFMAELIEKDLKEKNHG